MIDVNTSSTKDIVIYLFSDALLIAQEYYSTGWYEYVGSLIFDDLSYCYAKHDLKYYQNIFKVVS